MKLLALVVVMFAASSTAAAVDVPVLAGPWASNQQGYGHVRPRTVFNGGDPTGLVTHIHWTSWGRGRATGVGISQYVGPEQSVAEGTQQTVRVVLFQLGTCKSKRAYNAIEWYFPGHGQHFDPRTYINACTGSYHRT